MRSGISYPSHTGLTFSLTVGAAEAGYPVSRLEDKASIRRVFRADSAGAITIAYELAEEADVEFIGILHHNAEPTATYRHRLFDDADVLIYDSGERPFFPPPAAAVEHFVQSTPHICPTTRAASGTLELSAHTQAWQIGGLEVAGFWEWTDVEVPREFGVKSNDVTMRSIEGADHTMTQFKPRLVAGSRSALDATTEEATIISFQRRTGTWRPFVWMWDYDDPETWPREVFLVRNERLPPVRRGDWPECDFSFRFIEHVR